MAAALIALIALLPKTPLPERKVRLRDPLLALGNEGLRTTAASGLLYNYGFFTILAFTPFILGMDAYGIGGVLFGWAVAVAVFSVFAAPVLQNLGLAALRPAGAFLRGGAGHGGGNCRGPRRTPLPERARAPRGLAEAPGANR